MVLDPEQMDLAQERGKKSMSGSRKNLLSDLSKGAPSGERYVENGVDAGTYAKIGDAPGWIHWGAFGTPGTPDEEGRNEYGFKPGPPFELDTKGKTGGTNVADYGDFLDLFGSMVGIVTGVEILV